MGCLLGAFCRPEESTLGWCVLQPTDGQPGRSCATFKAAGSCGRGPSSQRSCEDISGKKDSIGEGSLEKPRVPSAGSLLLQLFFCVTPLYF